MLEFKRITLDSARLYEPSKIADIQSPDGVPFFICDDSVDKTERENIGKGMVSSVLPYRVQNCYDRSFSPREYNGAVLENEYLRAEFLPSLGGRLWSLYDKKQKRDLVYKNDSLIFANLALRNAWFAGGVEWNIGLKGHTFSTCSELFARGVVGKNGNDILRMYEYEEMRGLAYCIQATLVADKLIVNVSVKNTKKQSTYMYWWSNIAISETEHTRILVPANKTFVTSYREGGYRISKIDVPMRDGVDISYAKSSKIAIDYFYDIPHNAKKWICGVEKDGRGLLHYSSSILHGRKTFLWGKEPGGYHWNRWLTNKNEHIDARLISDNERKKRDYLEIQAGLCKTQFEHFPMDGEAELTWYEVYTATELGGNDGDYDELCKKIDSLVPTSLDYSELFNEETVGKIEYFGSFRGALAEAISGESLYEKCEFPRSTIGNNEEYYLSLLKHENFVGNDETPFTVNCEIKRLILDKTDKSFFDYYILGLICHAQGQNDKAGEYLGKSTGLKETYYNLAALGLYHSKVTQRQDIAFEKMSRAIELCKNYLPLSIVYGEVAIRSGNYQKFVDYCSCAPEEIKECGRIKMYLGQCLVLLGFTSEAKKYINDDIVVEDVREGEYAISNVWVMLYKKELSERLGKPEIEISDAEVLSEYPLSYAMDFRMH